MNDSGRSHIRSWRSSLAGVLLAGAFLYVWILPLFRPRGDFLWGHYRLKDIYLGIPIALITLCVILILIVPSRYKRSLALRLVTVVISLLAVFAICDAGFAFGVMGVAHGNYWLDQGHIPRRYSAADPELGFVRRPFVSWRGYVPTVDRIVEYRTDENGFRNAPGQKQADIVFIGDSFTEAAAVAEQDTFVQRVGQATGLSVVNLGRGAYGPQQELIVLKRYGLAYKPRVVVWQLFEGNDLKDAEQFARWQKNHLQSHASLKERYFNNSLLKEWLAHTRLEPQVGPLATLRYHGGAVRRVVVGQHYEPDEPSTRNVGMTETMAAIEEGQQLCESNGIQFLVVFIPTMLHTMERNISFDRAEDQAEYLPQREGVKNFSQTMQEFCNRAGCTFVDSIDALRQAEANGSRSLYIPYDEHLDVGGHDAMARLIAGWLGRIRITS